MCYVIVVDYDDCYVWLVVWFEGCELGGEVG